jgi:hypothetical protein
MGQKQTEHAADEWVTFPGGELEGKRPKSLCPTCREALRRAAAGDRGSTKPRARTLCFQCYRADLERDRALKSAADLNTTSETRFQFQLPFEPLNRPRLETLKAARGQSRAARPPYVDQRRRAQIDARRALADIAAGLKARGLAVPGNREAERLMFQAVHAAELQLPDSWIPFVVAR